MQYEAKIQPLEGKLPKVSYRWDPETDILSAVCKGIPKATGMNGTVDLGCLCSQSAMEPPLIIFTANQNRERATDLRLVELACDR